MKPINDPDIQNTDKDYWEKVLRSHGLGVRRGTAPMIWKNKGTDIQEQLSTVLFVGTSQNLEGIEEEQLKTCGELGGDGSGFDVRRAIPEGHSPDK